MSKCTACGGCCCGWSHDGVPLTEEEFARIPPEYVTRIDGKPHMLMVVCDNGRTACSALTKEGKCAIHEVKSDLCRRSFCLRAGGRVHARYFLARGTPP